MADRSGLKFVGFIFATVTLAVMLTAGMVVKGYADGAYSLDGSERREPVSHHPLTMISDGLRVARRRSAAPDQRQHHHRHDQQSDKPDHDGAHPGR